MLTNIVPRTREHIAEFAHSFDWADHPGCGFGFPCDSRGHVDLSKYGEAAVENLASCLFGIHDVIYLGIADYSRDLPVPAHGKCPCGRDVELEGDYGHGIDCDCGRIYNMDGRELAPRSQWEESYEEDDSVPYNVRFGYVGAE